MLVYGHIVSNRRNRHRIALEKRGVRRIHREYHDFDYLEQLSEEELDWLAAFIDAELQSNVDCPGAEACPPEKHADHRRLFVRSDERRRCLHGCLRIGYARVRKSGRYENDYLHSENLDQTVEKHDGETLSLHELVGNRTLGLEEDVIIARLDAGKKEPD